MPVIVQTSFPEHVGLATGVVSLGIQTGAMLSATLSVPIAQALGGWRGSLGVVSIATILATLLWYGANGSGRGARTVHKNRVSLPLRDPVAWLLVIIFTLGGIGYHGMNAWLPSAYIEQGWSAAAAGGLLGALNGAAVPAGFIVSWVSDRGPGRGPLMAACSLMLVAATVGFSTAPSLGWVWALGFGSANGGLFALSLALPVDVGRSTREVAGYAGMMMAVGYTVLSASPFLLGVVRDFTGGFEPVLWVLAVVATLYCASCCAYVYVRRLDG